MTTLGTKFILVAALLTDREAGPELHRVTERAWSWDPDIGQWFPVPDADLSSSMVVCAEEVMG